MASKVNSEFNYRYQVIGETVWEKIKTLHGFLAGRVTAAQLEAVSALRYKAKLAKLKWLKATTNLEHEVLAMEADILETDSILKDQADCFELNRQEVIMLERLLAELYVVAEPTRIPGYTDEQMFEANAANEFTVWVAKEIQAEIIATGRPSPAKLRNAMSNPYSFAALKAIGMIPADTVMLIGNVDPLQIGLMSETLAIGHDTVKEP